jgi:3-hydroxy-9,10-secoandrosta-1,3,5(10)-triene-9,17-dione monooxygenase reductase component
MALAAMKEVSPPSAMADQRSLRDALGRFVTGVTVVTSRTKTGRTCGVTVNSFSSLSMDPPLVLWSLSLTSSSHPAFDEATHFIVHVLADGQEGIARQFARSGIDRFAGLELEEGPEGIPVLPDVAARFECRTLYRYWGGDHVIFVGQVEAFVHAPDRDPLVFFAGAMRHLADVPRL